MVIEKKTARNKTQEKDTSLTVWKTNTTVQELTIDSGTDSHSSAAVAAAAVSKSSRLNRTKPYKKRKRDTINALTLD